MDTAITNTKIDNTITCFTAITLLIALQKVHAVFFGKGKETGRQRRDSAPGPIPQGGQQLGHHEGSYPGNKQPFGYNHDFSYDY